MYRNILVCSDGSDHALQAAHCGAELALKFNAHVILLHVFDDSNLSNLHEDVAHYIARVQHEVEQRTSPIFTQAGVGFESLHEIGDQVDVIVAVAARRNADLIVLGSRGLSQWKALLLGSVSDGVLQRASCPLLVVRGRHAGFQRIVLATDGSESSLKATTAAMWLTKEFDGELRALNVFEPLRSYRDVPADELDSDSYLWRVRAAVLASVKAAAEKAGVSYAFEQIVGKASEAIVHFAKDSGSDLIVMGNSGSGSVAKQVAHHAVCSVLFVR